MLYYETPFEKIDNISFVWDDIKTHNIKELTYNVMGTSDNGLIVNFILNDNDRIVNMVYDIEFNNEGKCNKFVQWYRVK